MPEPLVVISTLDAAIRSISQIVRLLREVKPGSRKSPLEETRKEMAAGFEALESSLRELRNEIVSLRGSLLASHTELAELRARVAELEAAENRRRNGLWARIFRTFRKIRSTA